MATKTTDTKVTPESQLGTLIEKFDAEKQKLIRSVRSAVRKRLPTTNELVYDYRTFFVISYSPTEQPLDSILTIAARPDGVRLYLMKGPTLPDPKKLLMGSATQVRYVPLESAGRVKHPDVEALIVAAIGKAPVKLATKGKGGIVIKTFEGQRKASAKKAKKAKKSAKAK